MTREADISADENFLFSERNILPIITCDSEGDSLEPLVVQQGTRNAFFISFLIKFGEPLSIPDVPVSCGRQSPAHLQCPHVFSPNEPPPLIIQGVIYLEYTS